MKWIGRWTKRDRQDVLAVVWVGSLLMCAWVGNTDGVIVCTAGVLTVLSLSDIAEDARP